jgi:hypothetical protein
LRAIWDYMDDKYAMAQTCPVAAAAGEIFSDLPSALSEKIRAFSMIVAVAYKASSSEIRELFIRLQRGVQLSQPEIRNAMPSQLGDTIRAVALTHKFCTHSPFTNDRYQTDDLVAHAFLVELTTGERDLKAPELRKMYKDYEAGINDATVKRVIEAMDVMHKMQMSKPRCISRKWGFVDVYWVLSALMHQRQKLDATVLADRYVAFERRRLRFVSQPERLIEGKSGKADRNLFEYIEAFKTSAGTASNLAKRHRVLKGILNPKS